MKNTLFSVLLQIICLIPVAKAQNSRPANDQINLWPNVMPDGPGASGAIKSNKKQSLTNISNPFLIVHRPDHPNGTAMLVISGGGYAHIEAGNESGPAAEWLASQGVTAFELIYRLPGEGWLSVNVPFEDGQRAMRIIRSKARQFKLNDHKIGIMGFSAGGHLAAMLATRFDYKWYPPADKTDTFPARPDFVALLYPVITMRPPYNHTHAYKEIIGSNGTKQNQAFYSPELQVGANTPPTFLAQAQDDPISSVQNSRLMYQALQQSQIPVEIHIFPTGGHGWGMGIPGLM